MRKYLLIICLLTATIAQAQFNISEYAPLKPGNQWVVQYDLNSNDRGSLTVLDSTITIDSIEYFILEAKNYSNGVLTGAGYKYCGLDSGGYNIVYKPDLYSEKYGKYYKNNIQIFDQWMNEVNMAPGKFYYKVIDTSASNWNGYETSIKLLEITDSSLFYQWQYWSDDFGLLQVTDFESGSSNYLIACVIDGKVYGDTSLTAIRETNTNVPENFILYQNYPNPFNPKTNIEFNIQQTDYITLKVYDILGKEVAILIEKEMPPGKYSVEFNGKALSSGVYIYILKTSGYSAINKMTLLK